MGWACKTNTPLSTIGARDSYNHNLWHASSTSQTDWAEIFCRDCLFCVQKREGKKKELERDGESCKNYSDSFLDFTFI